MENISIDLLIELIEDSVVQVHSGYSQRDYGYGGEMVDSPALIDVVSSDKLLNQLYYLKGETQ